LVDLQGEEQAMENYTGRPLIINFWASWCRFCVVEMPLLQELYASDENVLVLAVNIKEQKEDVAAFIRDAGYTFPVLLDEKGEVAAAYRIRGLPTTFAVNADGVITAVRVGAFDAQDLAALVESTMK
jgi:thiol-disulfide isomerase/thioredoxin